MIKRFILGGGTLFLLFANILLPVVVSAANAPSSFSLQVSPSPIIESVKPGQTSTVDVHIRNTGSKAENLKMGLRAFSVDNTNGDVQLESGEPKDVAGWVSFSDPQFSVDAGTSFTVHVQIAVPESAGFSYAFALLVSRAAPTNQTPGKTTIEGSVAIFTLLTVDRPDATKKIDVLGFSSKKKVYEFLPTEFDVQIKNSGNTIIQPSGNIFVQRSATSTTPLSVLAVNSTSSYILPGVTKTVKATWADGFPVYKTDSSTNKSHLVWDWGTLQKLRIGHYVAKTVVVYNDGTRDIPVTASVGFWIIPWRLLGGFLLIVLLVIVGIVTLVRKTARLARKKDEPNKD